MDGPAGPRGSVRAVLSTARCLCLLVIVACGPSSSGPHGDGGTDGVAAECSDGMHRCSGSTYQVCTGGMFVTQQECSAVCNEELGCVACPPNAAVCKDGNVHTCTPAGEIGPQSMACTGQTICQNGGCVNACESAAMSRSYTGCEYWAADLDNGIDLVGPPFPFIGCVFAASPGAVLRNLPICLDGNGVSAGMCDPPDNACPMGFTCQQTDFCVLDAAHSPFGIVVSNPQARSVDVTVTGGGGQSFTRTIPAGQVQALMPQPPGMAALIPDQSLDGTGKERKAYKVTSTLPIVAYQFNPLDNVNVFSNDASLLVPSAAFDTEYYVMSWPTLGLRTPAPGYHNFYGYLSVVAWKDGTQIEVTPTAPVQASATQTSIAAGATTTFTLNAFDVLTLQAAAGTDLTGTHIRSIGGGATFGVFGGHEAARFGEATPPDMAHTSGPCCADHLEEMLFPTSTWGKTFAIVRSQMRGTNEPDILRIMAQKAGTSLSFTPPVASGTCNTLGPGQFCEVKIQVDTAITATEPVLIGHYLQSAVWGDPVFGGAVGEGDPSMAIAVPAEQFRTEYTILIPNSYDKNFVSIGAHASGAVLLDGNMLTLDPFGGGLYRSSRQAVAAGQHKITCPSGCGIEVYGYSQAVSYMFAGGLDLKQIVIQ